MTDEERWLTSDDPKGMAHQFFYERHNLSVRLSPRKCRLVGCACCRFVWSLMPKEQQRAVEVAERFAEGRADEPALQHAYAESGGCATAAGWDAHGSLYWSVAQVVARMNEAHRQRLRIPLPDHRYPYPSPELERLAAEDGRRLCEVIRDVAGNPYRPVTLDPCWLDANGGLARAIAGGIDADSRFDEVAILGDALQDAGCSDETILAHAQQLRHYRGCWLIDAILGKC
jgi:hypothetical protein